MASLQDIEQAFNSKQSFDVGKDYKGASQVGFVGDKATLAGQTFSSPQDLYNTVYGGGSGVSASTAGNYAQPEFESTLSRALEIQNQAVQPAVQSLQSSIPEIEQKFATQRAQLEAEKDPLKARYNALIDDISRRQGVAETGAIKTTSRELGRRGIVGSSGVADVAMQEAVQPIQSEYGSLATQAGLERETGLRELQNQITNLTPLEVEATRDVQNAIAQLQSATTQAGVNQALSQLQLAQNKAQQAESARQFNAQQEMATKQFEQISLPESQANLANIQSTIANRGADGSGLGIDDFMSIFGMGGQTQMQSTGFSNVDQLIAEGKYDEARELLLNP